MNIKLFIIWLVLISFSLTTPLFAQVYKYKDDQGHIVFTDDLSKVPPDKRADVQKYKKIERNPDEQTQMPSEGITDGKQTVSEEVVPEEEEQIKEPSPGGLEKNRLKEQRQQLENEYLKLLEQKETLVQEEASAAKRYRVMKDKSRYRIKRNRLNRQIKDLNKTIAGYEKKIQALDAQLETLAESRPSPELPEPNAVPPEGTP